MGAISTFSLPNGNDELIRDNGDLVEKVQMVTVTCQHIITQLVLCNNNSEYLYCSICSNCCFEFELLLKLRCPANVMHV